jgi:hypothetical protein
MNLYRLFIVVLLGVAVFALSEEKKGKEEGPPQEILGEVDPDPLYSKSKINADQSITLAPYLTKNGAGAKITLMF